MKTKLTAAIAAAIALLSSSATALADPPAYFFIALAKPEGGPLSWMRCDYRGTWNAGVKDVLPGADTPQLWVIGFHLANRPFGYLPPVPVSVADAYVCGAYDPASLDIGT